MKTLASSDDRAELIRRLATVRRESVARWGRMSAHQMICHLADAFRMATGDKTVAPRHSLLTRTALKYLVLAIPLPWPPGVPTSPELDQFGSVSTKPREFAADVQEVAMLIEQQALGTASLGAQPHPIFGPMSSTEWLRWGWLHTNHHLRQFGA